MKNTESAVPTRYLARRKGFGATERRTTRALREAALQYFDRDSIFQKKSGLSLPRRRFFNDPRLIEPMEERLPPGTSNSYIPTIFVSIKARGASVDRSTWLSAARLKIAFGRCMLRRSETSVLNQKFA
jgi:hypothetical protein